MPHDQCFNGQTRMSELHSIRYLHQIQTKDYQNVLVFYIRNYGPSNMEKASMKDVKSWLLEFLRKESRRKGYLISVIY